MMVLSLATLLGRYSQRAAGCVKVLVNRQGNPLPVGWRQ